MSNYTVSGVQVYSDVILQANRLTFDTMSTLLLASEPQKGGGPPTTLTIIANEIIITDTATITYSFDGVPGPGFDPGTPAPPQTGTGANGGGGSSISGTGPYPQAANGGDGGPGVAGKKGTAGVNAPELQIFVGLVKQKNPGVFDGELQGTGRGQRRERW